MQGTIPVGKRGGCLPRITKPGQWCPLFGSSIKVIPKNQWKDYAQQISLKPFVRNVYNQKQVGSCFPSNVQVLMDNSQTKQICDVQPGDRVVTAEGNIHVVTQTMSRLHHGNILSVLADDSHDFDCTPEHPIFTTNGYVPAYNLTREDKLICHDTMPSVFVDDIISKPYYDYVFNLEVEHDHSYVVNGIGVHNCASESTNQSVAIGMAKAGLADVLFNPYGMYHFVNGGRDQGSTIDGNLKFAREFGCFPESVWSRSNGWQRKPSADAMEAAKLYRILEFYDIQTIDEFVTALLMGFPVVYGANGHAVCAIQHLEDKQAPLIVNSWSTDWGDNGFGVWVNYASLRRNLSYGAFAVRTTTQNQPLFNLSV